MSEKEECDCDRCCSDRNVDVLMSSILYLMSRYVTERDSQLMPPIEQHLVWLSEHSGATQFPALQKTCTRLALSWRSMQSENQVAETNAKSGQMLH